MIQTRSASKSPDCIKPQHLEPKSPPTPVLSAKYLATAGLANQLDQLQVQVTNRALRDRS